MGLGSEIQLASEVRCMVKRVRCLRLIPPLLNYWVAWLVTKIVGLLHVKGDKLVMVTELLFLTRELHGFELDCK